LGEAIQEGLNAAQHIATLVHTGEEGFYRVQTESLDLVVLDARSVHTGALLKREEVGLSTAGGQASLQTLVDEPNSAIRRVPAVGPGRRNLSQPALAPRTLRAPTRSPPPDAGSPRRTKPATPHSGCRPSLDTYKPYPR
jgi:hypothetical protein